MAKNPENRSGTPASVGGPALPMARERGLKANRERKGGAGREARPALRRGAVRALLVLGTVVASGTSPAQAQNSGPPTISIDGPTSRVEGRSGTTRTIEIEVSFDYNNLPVGQRMAVDFAVSGSASTSTDYSLATPHPQNVDFENNRINTAIRRSEGNSGQNVTIRIVITGDGTVEPDETVVITLSNPSHGTIVSGMETATFTITNDDPVVSIDSPRTAEGDSGTTDLVFTVRLSDDSPDTLTVPYRVTGGTATSTGADADYMALPDGSLTFAPTERSKPITVTVNGDEVSEPDETVIVEIGTPTGGTASLGESIGTGTIANDEHILLINTPSLPEGDSGRLTFEVTLSAPSSRQVSVDFALADGTATGRSSGGDYGNFFWYLDNRITTATRLTFAPGQTSMSVGIVVNDDGRVESDETVLLRLLNPVNATLATSTGIGTIINDDIGMFSIDSQSVDEGAQGSSTTTNLTVTLAPAADITTTVEYSRVAASSTADAGTDYTGATMGTLTFDPGDTSKTIPLTILGDDSSEDDETVVIQLSTSTPPGITEIDAGRRTGIVTIRNDDLPGFSIDSPDPVAEGDDGTTNLVFTVTLNRAVSATTMVDWAVSGGTADSADYAGPAMGTLTFAPDETSKTITIAVRGDTVTESDETVEVTLSNPAPSSVVGLGTGTGRATIRGDDLPTLSIPTPAPMLEGTDLVFTAMLSATSPFPVTVDYAAAGGTASEGTDYRLPSGSTLTIPAGDPSGTLTVTVVGDDLDEEDETVAVRFSIRAGAVFPGDETTTTVEATIRDDDTSMLSIDSPAEVSEGRSGTTPLVFTVELAPPSSREVTVDWAVGGTAMSGDDYTPPAGGSTLTFAPGATSTTIEFGVRGDTDFEPDETETVVVELSDPGGGAGIATSTGTGTIRNDDHRLSIDSPSVVEGDSGNRDPRPFTVTLEPPSSGVVMVEHSQPTGVPPNEASILVDYSASLGGIAGTLDIQPGMTMQELFPITVIGDEMRETDEVVLMEIRNPSGPAGSDFEILTSLGTFTILDDDGGFLRLTVDSPSVDEDAGPLVFRVALSAATSSRVAFDYAVAGAGTRPATAGNDFRAVSGTETIEAGATSTTISVEVIDDGLVEHDETVGITLSNPTGGAEFPGRVTTLTRTGTIRNDDLPRLTIDSPSVREGAPGMTPQLVFTVMPDPTPLAPATVDYAVAMSGMAEAGTDYTGPATGTLTFMPGDISRAITLSVEGDDVFELDETVVIELSNAMEAEISQGTGTGRILRDEPVVSIDPQAESDNAGGIVFTAGLDVAPSAAVTLDWMVTAGTAAGLGNTSGTLVIPANRTSGTFVVRATGAQLPEMVDIMLSNPTGGAVFDSSGVTQRTVTVEIVDALTLSIAGSPSVNEGAGPLEFTVELNAATTSRVAFDYAVAGAGARPATAGADFRAASGRGEIRAGATSTTINVEVIDDGLVEHDETVGITLSNPTEGAEFRGGAATLTGTGTIRDDDLPELSIDSPSVAEGAPGMTPQLVFTVTLDQEPVAPATVDYAVAMGGMAEAGTDYTGPASGMLTFMPGDASETITFTVEGDDVFEPDETVEVELSNAAGADISQARGTGTILRDEPVASLDAQARPDDAGGIVFTVRLDVAPSRDVTLDWMVTAGTAAGLGNTTGMLTIPANRTSGTFVVQVTSAEPPEMVDIVLSNPTGGAVFDSSGGTAPRTVTVAVVDAPTLSIAGSPSVDEGAGPLVFTVELNAATTSRVAFDYAVAGAGARPATAGDDFRAASGRGAIEAGGTSTTINVAVIDDGLVEHDETVGITLSNPTEGAEFRGGGATLTGTGTIRDDDLPRLSIDSPSVAEGAPGMTPQLVFTVTLDQEPVAPATVDYAVRGGTATAGTDFQTLPAGTLTFAAGSSSRMIAVTVIGDDDFEQGMDETVVIELSNAMEAEISRGTGTGRILRDEPVVSIDPQAEPDDAGNLVFTVTLDRAPSAPVSVLWTAAALGNASGTLVIPAGRTSGTFEIPAVGGEVPEAVDIVLSSPTGGAAFDETGSTAPLPVTVRTTNPRAQTIALTNALSGIGRTIASNVVELFWERAGDHRSGGRGSYALVGGRPLDAAFAGGGAEDGAALRLAGALAGLLGIDAGSPGALLRGAERRLARDGGLGALRDWADLPSGRDLAGRTRFAVSFDNGAGGGADRLTFWGRGSVGTFKDKLDGDDHSALKSEGETTAAHLGIDYRLGGLLVGMALGHTVGDVKYVFAKEIDGSGAVETELTSLHPYLHWMSRSGFGAWASIGYGTGSAEVRETDGESVETDLTMEMAALGMRGGLAYMGNLDLAVKTDAFVSGTDADAVKGLEAVSADASRLRIALEVSTERLLGSGAVLAGRFDLGARLDDGDAGEGAGADIAAGFDYAFPRLGIEVEGSGALLLAHEEGGFEEWGLGLGLTYDPGAGGQGLAFSLEPAWGAPARNAASSLWDAGPDSLARPRARGASLDARLGYGMGALDGRALMTVFGELGGPGGSDRLRLGAGLRSGGGLGLELYGERRDLPSGPDRALVLKGRLGF